MKSRSALAKNERELAMKDQSGPLSEGERKHVEHYKDDILAKLESMEIEELLQMISEVEREIRRRHVRRRR